MFQKNHPFSIFASCYTQASPTFYSLDPTKLRQAPKHHFKQAKISLKKANTHSTPSYASCRPIKDITSQVNTQKDTSDPYFKEKLLLPTKPSLNKQSQQINYAQLKDYSYRTASRQASTASIVNNKQVCDIEAEEQKRVKSGFGERDRIKSENIGVFVEKGKMGGDRNFIQNLMSYRQSLVSINIQNERQYKMEESAIVVNFFNPTGSKVKQIHNYLAFR